MVRAIREVREVVPGYAGGTSATENDVTRIAAWAGLRTHLVSGLDSPAILTPAIGGVHRLALSTEQPRQTRRHLILHECMHVWRGDAEGLVWMHFDAPLPEAELACDLFSLAGLVPWWDLDEGADWVEGRIWALVPLDDRGWRLYRRADLAPRLIRMREIIEEDL